MKKITRIDAPYEFKEFYSKYPQGHTIFEAILDWLETLNNVIEDQNELKTIISDFIESFEGDLQNTIIQTLEEWEVSGRLADIINQALFESKADKTYVDAELDLKADNVSLNKKIDIEKYNYTKDNMSINELFTVMLNNVDSNQQGYARHNNLNYLASINRDSETAHDGTIRVYTDLGVLIRTEKLVNVGHMNDMTIANNRIYITTLNSETDIKVYDLETFTFIKSINISGFIMGVDVYEDRLFIQKEDGANSFFEIIDGQEHKIELEKITNNVVQTFKIYEDKVFSLEAWSNAIFVHSLITKKLLGVINIPETINYKTVGEVEGIDIYNNIIYFTHQILNDGYTFTHTISTIDLTFKERKQRKTIYNTTSTMNISVGENNKDFKNIKLAIEYAKILQTKFKGEVVITNESTLNQGSVIIRGLDNITIDGGIYDNISVMNSNNILFDNCTINGGGYGYKNASLYVFKSNNITIGENVVITNTTHPNDFLSVEDSQVNIYNNTYNKNTIILKNSIIKRKNELEDCFVLLDKNIFDRATLLFKGEVENGNIPLYNSINFFDNIMITFDGGQSITIPVTNSMDVFVTHASKSIALIQAQTFILTNNSNSLNRNNNFSFKISSSGLEIGTLNKKITEIKGL